MTEEIKAVLSFNNTLATQNLIISNPKNYDERISINWESGRPTFKCCISFNDDEPCFNETIHLENQNFKPEEAK